MWKSHFRSPSQGGLVDIYPDLSQEIFSLMRRRLVEVKSLEITGDGQHPFIIYCEMAEIEVFSI